MPLVHRVYLCLENCWTSRAYRRFVICAASEGTLTARCTQLSRSEQYGGHYRLLQLFAYGTYEDYLSGSNPSYCRVSHPYLPCRREGDLPYVEQRSYHEAQTPDPRLPRDGAKSKHGHRVTPALTERVHSYRFCLTRHSSVPCKCQRYEIWRI